MVELIKRLTGEFFDFTKRGKTKAKKGTESVLKTRTQLIEEGKSAYLPKRHRYDVPVLKKH